MSRRNPKAPRSWSARRWAAFEEGQAAGRDGALLTANPYPPQGVCRQGWADGWRLAQNTPRAQDVPEVDAACKPTN